MTTLETDYLVIGAGTAGMAFVDTLIDETDAHVTIVDHHAKPGGHWNDAYPFVTLHQPSAFYGVNSTPLGSGRIDAQGLNQGLYELASGAEICAYFETVMNHRLLPSGRVSYHPMCNFSEDGHIESLLSGQRTTVRVRKKVVDAAYFGPTVPATHQRRFAVDAGVRVVAPGELMQLWRRDASSERPDRPERFVILGAGKTAMDSVSWLLSHGVPAEAVQWVMPRDSWLINRITTQPGMDFFGPTMGGQADQLQAMAVATSTSDLFARLEACGALLRIHREREPTMFHLATVTPAEVEVLRRVQQVVRLGRVLSIHGQEMVLQQGRVPVLPGTLFVDCTASAVEPRPLMPIFQDNKIVLQICRLPQPAFSAALCAYVEAHYEGDKTKNRLCGTVPFPHRLADYPRAMFANLWNQAQWGQDKVLRQWIRASRLDGFGKLLAAVAPDDTDKQAILARLKQHGMAAMANLPKLIAAAG